MPPATPLLETERLLLRPPALEDLDRWSEMMADERSARFIGGVQPKPVVWRALMSIAGAWALTGIGMFSVLDRATGTWLGRIGPWRPYGWPGDEIGWALHPDAWGKGYAAEAAAATMDYAFDVLGWPAVIHSIDPDNLSSKRVAERLGSAYLGPGQLPAPYETVPIELWGQTRAQWEASKARRAATREK